MSLTAQAEKRKVEATAELKAEVLTGELSGRMIALATAVVSNPKAFNAHQAHKLRNAAQLAGDAADLIDLERTK